MAGEKAAKKVPFWSPRRVARMAIFIGLSVVGAYIKIPSPTGTVAMDSCPGYFSALAWGYLEGGIIIALGHIATAASTGFPLGALHVLVAILMMMAAALLRIGVTKFPIKTARLNLVVGTLMGATFNGLMAILMSPLLGWGLAVFLTPSLMVASYIDVIISVVAFGIVEKTKLI